MKNFYLSVLAILALSLFLQFDTNAQGCVAIRSGCGANVGGGAILGKGQWQAGTNFRYFHSYKHFRGKHEETERVENNTEVINDSFFLDFLVSYGLSDRLSLNVALPFVYHDRSSIYEHGGNPRVDNPDTPEDEFRAGGTRNTTSSKGLADVRLSASYWLLDPAKSTGSNISLGLGVKLASGDYRAQDNFYNQGDSGDEIVLSGVDQSIQPGDGGYGATIDVQAFHTLSQNVILSTNLYYLINPREYYTLEARGSSRDFSVPDQYAARLGALVMTPIPGLFFYGGGRVEGVPSSDLIGGDEGFRRPGYAISLEPGLSYGVRNTAFNLTVPIAVERNRTQNFSDKASGGHGDAAFADYLINFGFSWRFGGKAASSTVLDVSSEPIGINQ